MLWRSLFVLLSLAVPISCTASDTSSSSPVGTTSAAALTGRYDVGGYELVLDCRGEGAPTVILEAGYDSSGIDTWNEVMPELADSSRVCTYDRAGTGAADARPDTPGLTSADQADELGRLLDAAGVDGPYVVVGHSYGGFVARLFAAANPDDVDGLILIDSSHEDEIEPYRRFYDDRPAGDWVDGGYLLDIDATGELLRATARDFGEPAADRDPAGEYEPTCSRRTLWHRTQADLATLSSDALPCAGDGGSFVQNDDRPVVVAAIGAVVAAAATGSAAPAMRDRLRRDRRHLPRRGIVIDPSTVYDAVGGQAFFDRLVDRFYDGVESDDVLLPLYPDPDDLQGARRRLAMFLAQYWGGPTTYNEERGHPRLRMRHAPFAIGPEARERWLAHMPPRWTSWRRRRVREAFDSTSRWPPYRCGTSSSEDDDARRRARDRGGPRRHGRRRAADRVGGRDRSRRIVVRWVAGGHRRRRSGPAPR